jgi:hypothetical protein
VGRGNSLSNDQYKNWLQKLLERRREDFDGLFGEGYVQKYRLEEAENLLDNYRATWEKFDDKYFEEIYKQIRQPSPNSPTTPPMDRTTPVIENMLDGMRRVLIGVVDTSCRPAQVMGHHICCRSHANGAMLIETRNYGDQYI